MKAKLFSWHSSSPEPSGRRAGFTLLQLILTLSLIAILSAMLFGVLGRGRAAARRAECDIHMKEIAMALDTFRQETGHMPQTLGELATKKYVSPATLRCGSDPKLQDNASNASYSSYSDFYMIREPRDSGELPVLICPFHESDSQHGVQAYKGRYTAQFTTRPATMSSNDIAGVVTVSRPGQGILALPGVGKVLVLRGGDRIKVGAGSAKVSFADGSYASIQANTEMSVLQSYIEGQRSGPLYTLTRQFSGRVNYYVNPGSRFDVATPTATAGALGTRFTIDLTADTPLDVDRLEETVLTVQESVVALTNINETIEVTAEDGPVMAAPTSAVTSSTGIVSTTISTPTGTTTVSTSKDKKQRKPRKRGKTRSRFFNF